MKGLDRKHSQDGTCLVAGCTGRAIYRTGSRQRHESGYCAQHKQVCLDLMARRPLPEEVSLRVPRKYYNWLERN